MKFLRDTKSQEYVEIIAINISIAVIFVYTLFGNYYGNLTRHILISFIILGTIMFVMIQKTLVLYYKQKLLEKTMADYEKKFDKNKIHSVELNLLDGQVELILRALELYGYNLEYMLNSNDATDEQKQEKISMLKYTYEQVLASQAEQVDTKANNIDNLSSLGKLLSNNFVQTQQKNNLKAI